MVTFVSKGNLVPLTNYPLSTDLALFSTLMGGGGSVTAHAGTIVASPYVIDFTGNFQFVPADPVTSLPATFLGTVTSISGFVSGTPFFTLTGLNVSLPELISAAGGNPIGVEADIFKGNDTIVGGPLGDILRGYGGNDTIRGNGSSDVLYGDSGNDLLDGGTGVNVLFGGPGHDVFRFSTKLTLTFDTIADFHHGIDKIYLSHTLVGLPIGALPAADFHTGTSAQNHNQHFIYDATTGNLYYDHDGSGPGAAVHIAEVLNGAGGFAHLSASDFMIY